MPHPIIHNREDPMSAPKYSQNHVAQYMGEWLKTKCGFYHKIPQAELNDEVSFCDENLDKEYK